MDPSEERRIERFVRRPNQMAEEDRLRAKRLLEEDPGAALYAKILRGFYDMLEEEKGRPPDPRVDAFVDRLFGGVKPKSHGEEGASVIPVSPLTPGSEARPTVLAADAPASATREESSRLGSTPESRGGPRERRFVVLAALASAGESVLVRIIGDRKTGRGRLYVLPGSGKETRQKEPHVVVSFPELGRNIPADENGRAAFDLRLGGETGLGRPVLRERWASVSAIVRRPVASKTLLPGEATAFSVPAAGHFPEGSSGATASRSGEVGDGPSSGPSNGPSSRLLCRREGGTLAITTGDESADGPALLAVSGPEGEPALISLRSGRLEPRAVPSDGPLTLRVYR